MLEILSKRGDIFCDHFHIPLQSGSDRILKLMGRPYSVYDFKAKLELVRKFFPKAFISTDIIAGFPGETEDDFEESYGFVKGSSLNSLHVFPYSDRPLTKAREFGNHLSNEMIKSRAKILRETSKAMLDEYRSHFLGKMATVLWENSFDSLGRRIGHSLNYLEVISLDQPERGQITKVLLTELGQDGRFLGKVP